MTPRPVGRHAQLAAVACALTLTAAGCALTGDGAEPEHPVDLAHQAQQVGVALDVWHSALDHDLLPEFRPAVLRRAGIRLPKGVQVTDYATVRTGSTATSDDLWQFCLTGPRGSWATYGDSTTLQDLGTSEDGACRFTGESHPDPPSFDVRGLAQDVYATMKADSVEDEPSLRVWGDGRTSGSNPKLKALVEERLPDGWVTSRVDQRGYSAVQYCLTAPTGEWYYVHHSSVEKYGDAGRCRLDPDMRSLG